MPFGEYFDEYYENIYKPAIEESNLDSFRADNIYMPSTIVKDIWNLIQSSSIIIADLTSQNANVFYELGLAHASKKPVIFISESMDDVPFDLRAQRVITYNKDNYNWGKDLKNKIDGKVLILHTAECLLSLSDQVQASDHQRGFILAEAQKQSLEILVIQEDRVS